MTSPWYNLLPWCHRSQTHGNESTAYSEKQEAFRIHRGRKLLPDTLQIPCRNICQHKWLPHTACRGIDRVYGMEWCGKFHPHLRSHSGSTHPQCHIVNPILAYFVYFFQSPLCLLPSAVAHIHHRPCEAFPHPAPLSACCKPVGWGSNGNSQKSRCPPHKNVPELLRHRRRCGFAHTRTDRQCSLRSPWRHK